MSASVAERYDDLAAKYDGDHVGGFWEIYDAATLTFAGAHLPPGGRVLDVGAGSGKFARWFLERGYEVALVDPSTQMLQRAQEKLVSFGSRASFHVGVVERLQFPTSSFDFVFCEGDPLSYARDERDVGAREILRVLRPGGGLYVSCDNRGVAALGKLFQGDARGALDALENGRASDPYGLPVHAFRPDELRDLLEAAGACDVRVGGKVALAHFAPKSVTHDPSKLALLHSIEEAVSRDPAFIGLATHLHATGRKP